MRARRHAALENFAGETGAMNRQLPSAKRELMRPCAVLTPFSSLPALRSALRLPAARANAAINL